MQSPVEIPDVDLDVKDREKAASLFPNAVVASQMQQDRLVPHNSGIYFQNIPVDPTNGISTFPYKMAEDFGYFKVDLLPNHVYDMIDTNEELDSLLKADVDWDWFLDERFYNDRDTKYRLTHIAKYHDLVCKYPPTSVGDIAALIALIRPRKKYLIGKPWVYILDRIWEKLDNEDQNQYFFKKSHAVAFALLVTVHAQLIARRLRRIEAEEEDDDGFFL